jgi:hypothetical protein
MTTDLRALLDTNEVASLLRMSRDGVRKLVERERLIPAGRASRGMHLFRAGDVARYMGLEEADGDGETHGPLGRAVSR